MEFKRVMMGCGHVVVATSAIEALEKAVIHRELSHCGQDPDDCGRQPRSSAPLRRAYFGTSAQGVTR